MICWGAVVQHRIDTAEAFGRFTQWAGWQAAAVTQAARVIDQHQFQIAGQPVMLQTVIRQDHVQRLGGQQRFHRTAAIRIDH